MPQATLDQLADTRIGYSPEGDARWRYGMDARYLVELVEHWRTRYDWRAEESKFNRWPPFMADIDGVPIHFHHVRSKDDSRPIPILLIHC